MVYFAYFHSVMRYGIIFWGNSSHREKIFRLQKQAIRIICGKKKRESCKPLFEKLKVLTLTGEYIYSVMCYVVDNIDKFQTNFSVHGRTTRNMNELHRPTNSLKLFQKGAYYSAIQIYNKLPNNIKLLCIQRKSKPFKTSVKEFLITHTFYNLEEYFQLG